MFTVGKHLCPTNSTRQVISFSSERSLTYQCGCISLSQVTFDLCLIGISGELPNGSYFTHFWNETLLFDRIWMSRRFEYFAPSFVVISMRPVTNNRRFILRSMIYIKIHSGENAIHSLSATVCVAAKCVQWPAYAITAVCVCVLCMC